MVTSLYSSGQLDESTSYMHTVPFVAEYAEMKKTTGHAGLSKWLTKKAQSPVCETVETPQICTRVRLKTVERIFPTTKYSE